MPFKVYAMICWCICCAEACADAEPFNFVTATMSFPQPKSEPCIPMPALPAPIRRQPKEEPEVLGNSEAGGSISASLDARRQPRASNASLSSITVSRNVGSTSSLSQAPAMTGAGASVLLYS